MSQIDPVAPNTLTLFRHECLLAWRDMVSLATARGRWPARNVAVGALLLFAGLHWIAWGLLQDALLPPQEIGLKGLTIVTSSLALGFCMILSQALESVTRLFYARGDLDLLLASPLPPNRFFLPRLAAIAGNCWLTVLWIGAPIIHVLAIFGGPGWLSLHIMLMALAALAVVVSVWLAFWSFRVFGVSRTRLAAQVLAAVIGASFLIGLQLAAILQTGTISRLDYLTSQAVQNFLPAADHLLWWPARAALGDIAPLAFVLGSTVLLWTMTVRRLAPIFGPMLAATQSHVEKIDRLEGPSVVETKPAVSSQRSKEWRLLARDPWLVSQSLMQILYLLPPAALLHLHFGGGDEIVMPLVVAVLVMAMGQLAGGLAWLAISGEDARELLITAPIDRGLAVRAKVEAVVIIIAAISLPLLTAMAFVSVKATIVGALGIVVASISTILIQIWFAGDGKRSQFRRRQTTSRIAAFAEATVSILWAATFAIAAHVVLAGVIVAILPIIVMVTLRWVSSAQTAGHCVRSA